MSEMRYTRLYTILVVISYDQILFVGFLSRRINSVLEYCGVSCTRMNFTSLRLLIKKIKKKAQRNLKYHSFYVVENRNVNCSIIIYSTIIFMMVRKVPVYIDIICLVIGAIGIV
jgi:hypothetical protein